MRRLLSCVFSAHKILRTVWLTVSPLSLRSTSYRLCSSSLQGDRVGNGTHNKKALLADPQLFEDQFEELVTELTERDFTDPVLADALKRLRRVFMCDWSIAEFCRRV